MNFWLVKTEEDIYPIEKLKKDKETLWDSVRNFQARNYLTTMKVGDTVFIYHSNADVLGIVGTATVSKEAIPDPLQFKKDSDYFDKRSTKEKPLWFAPTLKFKEIFKTRITLSDIKQIDALTDCPLIKRGNRLSVIPITKKEAAALLPKNNTGV